MNHYLFIVVDLENTLVAKDEPFHDINDLPTNNLQSFKYLD